MGRIYNPNDASIDDILRRLAILESAAPAGYASITRGSLRVASVEGLIVEGSERVDGTLIVHGTEEVDGLLRVTGTLIVSGTASITGPTSIEGTTAITGPTSVEGSLDITGPTVIAGTFSIDGDTTITGETEITGNTTLTGDLNVEGDGKITVGNMVLDPSVNGGSVRFSGGPEVYASGGQLALYSNALGAWIELGSTAKMANGVRAVEITGSNIRLQGLPTVLQSEVPGSFVGALWLDASNNAHRVVAG